MKRFAMALTVASAAVFAGTVALSQAATQAKKAEGSAAALTFEMFKDAKGEYRWRLKSANGKSIADSGEGYKAKADCLHGIDLIKEGAAKAKVDEKP